MEEWNKGDANFIEILGKVAHHERNARNLTKLTSMSYNYVCLRLARLFDFGITAKIKQGQKVFYTRPSDAALKKAELILKE